MSAPEEEKKDQKPIIFITRRVKKVVGGHHGGSWKIAYADFVTAMMTFFMLMWLLSMLNKAQLEGISEYFKNPNQKSSQQAVETKVKTENALSSKMASGMNTNSEEKKEVKKQDFQEKKKEDEKIKVQVEAAKNNKISDANKMAMQTETTVNQKTMAAELQAMKQDLEKQIKSNPNLSQYKNSLNIKVTSQGLKIELNDLKNKPMFSKGQADFGNYAKAILQWLSPTLNKYPNRVMIVGHTDSTPLNRPNYSNWELSADRAAATRRSLVDSGMDDRKIVRIVGVADTDKLEHASENDSANRRIVIMVLTDKAYQEMQDQ